METTALRTRRWLLGSAALALLLLVVVVLALTPRTIAAPAFHGTSYGEPEPAPGFELVNHRGEAVRLEDFEGRTTLLFFGFVNCPDVCPLTLSKLTRARETLGRAGEEVEVLLVTVDPERDDPQALASYIANFGERVTGITGAADPLADLRAAYGVFAERHEGHGDHGMVAHTDAVFGIDRRGQLRVLWRADTPEDHLRADIRTLLAL